MAEFEKAKDANKLKELLSAFVPYNLLEALTNMDTYAFLVSIGWISLGLLVIICVLYLVISGKLTTVEYQTSFGKISMQIANSLGIKGLSADEILAFEHFVYHDLESMEKGVRLAYIILFIDKDLLLGQFENNTLIIQLTEKGKNLHEKVIAECEKKLMITPNTTIEWKNANMKSLSDIETAIQKKILKSGKRTSKASK